MRSERHLSILLEIMYAISESEDRMILRRDFRRKANIYADKIEKELFDHEVIYTSDPRPLISDSDSRLLRHIEKIEGEIEELKRKDSDRKLANSSLRVAILCGIVGVISSAISDYLGYKREDEIARLGHRFVALEKTARGSESPFPLDSICLLVRLDNYDSLHKPFNLRFKIIDPQTLGTVRTNQLPIPSADSQDHDNRRRPYLHEI